MYAGFMWVGRVQVVAGVRVCVVVARCQSNCQRSKLLRDNPKQIHLATVYAHRTPEEAVNYINMHINPNLVRAALLSTAVAAGVRQLVKNKLLAVSPPSYQSIRQRHPGQRVSP
jgi:hypothetical protein